MIHTLLAVIFLLPTIFWLWMLVDCVRKKSLSSTQKFVWFLVIFFTYLLGAIAYFILGRSTNNVAYQPDGQPAPPTQLIDEQYEQPATAHPEQSQ